MRQPSRKQATFGAIAVVLAVALWAAAFPVESLPTGIDASAGGTGLGANRGCTCHSPTASQSATITFIVVGLDNQTTNGYYQANKEYTVLLSFNDSSVPMNTAPDTNKGGINVWASAGTFATGGSDLVQVMSDGTVSHTQKGDKEANRSFSFTWKAPAANTSDVTFDYLVNAVDGDGHQSAADHWSRGTRTIPGLPGAGGTGSVDISKLGVPLRAYWLGVIGILSTIFLVVLSFYVIRSGSKFYEFGLPRGQVKNVKIRTIPAPKTRGSYLFMTLLIVILALIVVSFLGIREEAMDTLQVTMFLMSAVIVMALCAVYYIRAFLPVVDVIEEETIQPLK